MPNIVFPAELHSNWQGYNWLASISQQLEPLKGRTVLLDAERLSWFDANLCSPLGALLSRTRTKINTLEWKNPQGRVLEVWMKNGFNVHLQGVVRLPDTYDTTIEYRRFTLGEEKSFIGHIGRELLTEGRLPRVNEAAKRLMETYFHEVFNNAVLHSASQTGVWTCGQHFPTKERLDFSVTDLGLGFGDRVRGFLRDDTTDVACIEWALQPGNTTKIGDIPGGLGLKRLHDFISRNSGQMHIISGTGCWMFEEGVSSSRTLQKSFNGTLINLSFNTMDDHLYEEDNERITEEISLF